MVFVWSFRYQIGIVICYVVVSYLSFLLQYVENPVFLNFGTAMFISVFTKARDWSKLNPLNFLTWIFVPSAFYAYALEMGFPWDFPTEVICCDRDPCHLSWKKTIFSTEIPHVVILRTSINENITWYYYFRYYFVEHTTLIKNASFIFIIFFFEEKIPFPVGFFSLSMLLPYPSQLFSFHPTIYKSHAITLCCRKYYQVLVGVFCWDIANSWSSKYYSLQSVCIWKGFRDFQLWRKTNYH